jgi:ABC-type transport system involved in multi-copper enzyme maturation permease subunit
MNSTYVIARRELAEKRFVLAAACAFSVLALLIPFFPGVHLPFSEVVTVSSGWLAVGFTLGLAATLGASIVGKELSDNRLSFYFSRPVSAPAIWFGKLLASAVMIALSFIIIGTPALLTGMDAFIRSWIPSTAVFVGAVTLAAAVLFFSAHALGTMVRSRSPWIALDFACLVVTALAVWALLMVPLRAMATMITIVAVVTLILSAAAVMIAGGAWQLTQGRTDRRLNHLALSRFLWTGIATAIVLAGAYVAWAMSAGPADLTEIAGIQSGHGWVLVEGLARHRGDYRPAFLINTEDRRTVRISAPPWWGYDSSRDGSTVAWMRPARIDGGLFEVMSCRLNVADPRPEATGITTSAHGLAISEDGRRVLVGWSNYTIYDLATHRSLGSFRVEFPPDSRTEAYFASNNIARVYVIARDTPGALTTTAIYEYDTATGKLRRTGTASGRLRYVSPDHLRMLVHHENGLSLDDASTGAVISDLSSSPQVGNARFLADGSIAVTATAGGTVALRHLSRDGAPLREVPIGHYFGSYVAGGDGHRAVVQLYRAKLDPSAIAVVNLDRGIVERTDSGIRRSLINQSDSLDDEVLCQTTTGVVAWNLSTGAKRLIAGR